MSSGAGRILTTHVGSLPRSQAVTDVLFAREREEARDVRQDDAVIAQAVAEAVRRQVELGIDVVSDGEMSKISYATYVARRLAGFAGDTPREPGQDLVEFPGLLAKLAERGATAKYRRPRCVGAIAVKDTAPLEADLRNLRAAAREAAAAETFMNAASPGVVALFQPNDYYRTQDEYLAALAAALESEYEAIVAAGVLLQIDAPDLAMGRHTMYRDRPLEEFERLAALHIEVLNHALRHVPAERARMHVCWGNYEGPHHHDVPMADIIDIVFAARPSGVSFEAANPRHAHEWRLFERVRLPEGKVLIPGVLESKTNYIEHPELVSQRIGRYAKLVGRENVIAGTDCGYGTWVGQAAVDPDVVWAKMAAMAEGARIATREFWGR